MFRVCLYFTVLSLIAFIFVWSPEHIDDIVIFYKNTRILVSSPAWLAIISGSIVLAALFLKFLHTLMKLPYNIKKMYNLNRQKTGEMALQKALIAASAKDLKTLKQTQSDLKKLSDYNQNPLIHLLEIKLSELNNNPEETIKVYQKNLNSAETKMVALYGLFKQAQKSQNPEALLNYAYEANNLWPHLEWAHLAILGDLTRKSQWDKALIQIENYDRARAQNYFSVSRDHYTLLFTAKALDQSAKDPKGALSTIRKALKMDPTFIPAILVKAKLFFSLKKSQKALSLLEKTWIETDHPNIAELYVYQNGHSSAVERLARVQRLMGLSEPTNATKLILARCLLETGSLQEARTLLEKILETNPSEKAYLIMADLEEAHSGNTTLVRQWLTYAATSAKDPTWVSGDVVSPSWLPVCPKTGTLGAFKWSVPNINLKQASVLDVGLFSLKLPYQNISDLNDIHFVQQTNPLVMIVDDPGINDEDTLNLSGTNLS